MNLYSSAHIVALLLPVSLACAGERRPAETAAIDSPMQPPAFALHPIGTIQDDSAGTWRMGKPRAVQMAGRNTLLILDSDWKHILVHDAATGRLLGMIGNGYGAGPGELALPVAMVVSDTRVYILDYELRKVSVYKLTGAFVRDISIASVQARDFILDRDSLVVRLMSPDSSGALALFDLRGDTAIRYAHPLGSHDRQLAEAGAGGVLLEANGQWPSAYINGDGSSITSTDGSALHGPLAATTKLHTTTNAGAALPWTIPERTAISATRLTNGWLVILVSVIPVSRLVSADSVRADYYLSAYDATYRPLGSAMLRLNRSDLPVAVDAGAADNDLYVSIVGPSGRVEHVKLDQHDY